MKEQQQDRVCGKCSSTMEEGFIPDAITYVTRLPLVWYRGTPKEGALTGVSVAGRTWKYITAYRCTACGFLELYAS